MRGRADEIGAPSLCAGDQFKLSSAGTDVHQAGRKLFLFILRLRSISLRVA